MVTVDEVRSLALAPAADDGGLRTRPRQVSRRADRLLGVRARRDADGFRLPQEWRNALVETAPHKMRELVIDAWAMVVPKSVSAAYAEPE
jgi:hypothetical protein